MTKCFLAESRYNRNGVLSPKNIHFLLCLIKYVLQSYTIQTPKLKTAKNLHFEPKKDVCFSVFSLFLKSNYTVHLNLKWFPVSFFYFARFLSFSLHTLQILS